MLFCWNCGGAVVFGETGWAHADPGNPCRSLVVGWPESGPADDPNER
jgi:hypothetical protein